MELSASPSSLVTDMSAPSRTAGETVRLSFPILPSTLVGLEMLAVVVRAPTPVASAEKMIGTSPPVIGGMAQVRVWAPAAPARVQKAG
ncbi:hypothetical protein D3C80_1037600 [compost metagenome]